MTFSKLETRLCLTAAVLAAFAAGWFFRGEGSAQPLTVQTSRTLAVEAAPLPAPTSASRLRLININTATVDELIDLPGIGEKRAADIVRDRTENGPFRIPEDITRVNGIGESTLAGLLDYITTE